jgi:hypothetical protein
LAQRIKKIISFGDSFAAGDELLQDDHRDEIEKIINSTSDIIRHGPGGYFGKLSPGKKCKPEKFIELTESVNKYIEQQYNNAKQIRDLQFSHTYAGILGNTLDVPVINYARGGNSPAGIYNNIIRSKVEFSKSTLVLIGSTFVGRHTRMSTNKHHYSDSPLKHLRHMYEYETLLPFWQGKQNKEYSRYRELEVQYGDDTYFKYIQYLALQRSLQLYLSNIPHVFLDNSNHKNISTDLFKLDETKQSDIDYIISEINDVYQCSTMKASAIALEQLQIPHSQYFGHFSRAVHKHYADTIINYLGLTT